ncbi:putative PurR-regulated permease PerM [Spinactinospora alkalitolerans]|uniref:Putative PurR-regulated permease PerM n=1 Tax=Spinactinospora alkalitolerans TaxID=687207 RepID=A0A852TU51_9ACTN|nr:AI-2E family transporter [Spinactinospora alkalitolerans]NYE46392.1 putative PurR-regulated permease PerM [Spinactinospora alkalitolerans]
MSASKNERTAQRRPSPAKNGMPSWLPRAMMLAVWTIAAFGIAWWLFVQLQDLLVLLLISLFLALALEPAVNWLHRHRWPRGLATGAVMLLVFVMVASFFTVLGSMLVSQVVDFVDELPAMTRAVLRWINATFNTDFSPTNLLSEISSASGLIEQYASSLAGNLWGAGTTVLVLLFNGLTIALFTFYLCADGPRFRRTICSVLPPRTQREVLRAWEIAIDKTGGYIYSRALLALICAAAHYLALTVLDIPFAFALALWVGVLSQFIPTVGTYIGGVVPVLVALMEGPWPAIWILVFITVYQQFENYVLQPRITARTLDMHPAVAFASVIAGAAILGAPGALLALPAGASLQTFLSIYIKRYRVEEHPLLDADPDDAKPKPEPAARRDAETDGDSASDDSTTVADNA